MSTAPNFLIIGAQKSGTTTLYHAFKQHPEIYLPEVKELNYFFHESKFSKGIEYYKSFFQPTTEKAIGEASPGYICHPASPKRIYDALPDIKIILILRNPIDRAYSQYWDNRRQLTETLGFNEAFRRYSHYKFYEQGNIGYFTRGFYSIYLKRYYDYFPKENVLILKTEDLKTGFNITLQKCYKFLRLNNTDFVVDTSSKNKSFVYSNLFYRTFLNNSQLSKLFPFLIKRLFLRGRKSIFKYPPIDEKLRKKLVSYYKPFNDELEMITGIDFSSWNA